MIFKPREDCQIKNLASIYEQYLPIGLKNFVMGADIVHEKFGKMIQSEVWSQEISNHDWEIYRRLWPGR